MNAGFQLNAFDPNSLGDLKRLARSEGQQDVALRAAAKQFEALFLQMVMKSMRDATPASSLMDSEQTKMYQSLLDQPFDGRVVGDLVALDDPVVAVVGERV